MSNPNGMVELTPQELALRLRLPEEDGLVFSGSLIRVPSEFLKELAARTGPLDLTFADCATITGMPVRTFNRWRAKGLINVRALGTSRTQALRVAPAELVRVLRQIAADRNGTLAVPETPSQARTRGERDRLAALDACEGR